ncbi:MAG: hypothetical protein HOO86_03525 [Bacteroidales bacterium]|nr:hypothetical protein [Bacteroidales bacterium]
MIRALLLVFVQLPLLLTAQNRFQFIAEKIDFTLNASRFSTNGIYEFVNNSDHELEQAIVFPFSIHADSVLVKRVYNLTYNKFINFQQNNHSIVFRMTILPTDTVKLNLAYSQKTGIENVYILRSTQTWNKPLQKAVYSLSYDDSIDIDSVSLQPDSIVGHVYYWAKTNFFPKDDFTVRIK